MDIISLGLDLDRLIKYILKLDCLLLQGFHVIVINI